MYLGDFKEDGDLFFKFTTRAFATGIPTVLAGTPVLSVFIDENTTGKTTAESYFDLDVSLGSIVGYNNVRIDLSGDAFFATGGDYSVVITTGTVDSVSVVGEVVATFSIENRSMGQPVGATLSDDIAAIKSDSGAIKTETDKLTFTVANQLDANPLSWAGGTIPSQGVTGVPEVDVTHHTAGIAPTPATTGVPDVNTVEFLDTAVVLSNGLPDINVENWLGTLVTAATAGVPNVNTTTFLNVAVAAATASGEVAANVTEWQGTAPNVLVFGSVQSDMRRIIGETVSPTILSDWLSTGIKSVSDSGTTTTIVDTDLLEVDDYWNNSVLVTTSGTNQGHTAVITDFDAASDTLTFAPAAPSGMTTEDYILIPGLGLSNVAVTADAVWDEVLTGGTHNINTSAGRRLRQLQESGGYELGQIWIDTVNGTAGTIAFENGTAVNPVKTIADAKTLSGDATVNLSDFHVINGSTITLAETSDNESYFGDNWTLALGGQAINKAHFQGAAVSGTGTGASAPEFDHCHLGAITLASGHFDDCDIEGTVTFSATGSFQFDHCSHEGTAIIDFGSAVGATTAHVHDYHGAITIQNMGTGDILHFSSPDGKLTLDNTNDGGTVNMNGTFDLSNSSTGMTLNQGGDAITLLDVIKVVTDKVDSAQTEPTGVPAANETPLVKLAYTFMALRNKLLVSATKKQFFDDGGAVEWEKDLADDGTDYTESEANAP